MRVDPRIRIVLRAYIRMVLRESKSQTNTLDVWPLDFTSDERRREMILDAVREAVRQIKATLK
jgi:hypothetical protein